MENFIVSARKYRPGTFDSVIGQKALTTTLKNAVRSGKLAHAYLFCGPRGVGKTTCARIFAKTINCQSLTDDGEACGQCVSCKDFDSQRSLNIHELDAASNNSVENIKELIDQVQVPPQVGRYKVFIIDEVHMLSTAAFNAFLKTLEEPPSYVIFILATTEKNKILPTILSRCQIYDFNRMEVGDIVSHLKNVAEKEGITYDEQSLGVIARKADGGMRDALSIFDQAVSYTGGNLEYKKVIENLNVLDYEYYFSMTDAFVEHDVTKAMLLVNDVLNKGFDGGNFIQGLASHFRDLLVCQDSQTIQLLNVADDVKQKYLEQAKKVGVRFLYRAIKTCSNCDVNYRTSHNKRLLVEITLIELAQDDDSPASGRGPIKCLKPIFKNITPVAQPEVMKAQTAQSKVGQSQPISVKANLANASQAVHSIELPQPTRAKLKISSIATPSIHGLKTNEDTVVKKEQNIVTNTSSVKSDESFTQNDLVLYWLKFANTLPKDQTATAERMKDRYTYPRLLQDGFSFEVVLSNSIVLPYFETLRNQLEDYLRQNLKNSKVKMILKIDETNITKKAYSQKEQFVKLVEKHPFLKILQKELALDFD